MRKNTPMSVYNRVLAMHKLNGTQDLANSELAFLGVGEAKLLVALVAWADCDRTSYGDSK